MAAEPSLTVAVMALVSVQTWSHLVTKMNAGTNQALTTS
jgi:hypothetical protein